MYEDKFLISLFRMIDIDQIWKQLSDSFFLLISIDQNSK